MIVLEKGDFRLNVQVDDTSYTYRTIMGEQSLTLHFVMPYFVEIPLGAWTEFGGERYTLLRPENLKKRHTTHYEYNLILDGASAECKLYKLVNTTPGDGRLKFSMTARPHEFAQLVVDNLNARDGQGGWTVGACLDAPERVVSFSHNSCEEALGLIAQAFETEWEVNGREVRIRKVEYGRDSPLPLSYGRGNGLKPGVGRTSLADEPPIGTLYVQGGERNIDPSAYGARELRLPRGQSFRFDGERFEWESGYVDANGRGYETDPEGRWVRPARIDRAPAEDSLDCSDVYPHRVGTVTGVECESAEGHLYDAIDSTIPDSLDYADGLIAGERMTIIFQTGMLAGREFDLAYEHAGRRLKIVPKEYDGRMMPGGAYLPAVGDEYAVFHCALPTDYICNNEKHTGASWDMLKRAAAYLYERERQQFTLDADIDGHWAKQDWANRGGALRLGGYVLFSDERMLPEGALLRVKGIRQPVNDPHSPRVELSNRTAAGNLGGTLRRLKNEGVRVEDLHRQGREFTQRTFSQAQEALIALEKATGIRSIQTMDMLVGRAEYQFDFFGGYEGARLPQPLRVNQATNTVEIESGEVWLRHETLDVTEREMSPEGKACRWWRMGHAAMAAMEDPKRYYYVYVVLDTHNGSNGDPENAGRFICTPDPITDEPHTLLCALVSSRDGGQRSLITTHGYTEILPGQIRTDSIATADGRSYLNLRDNELQLEGSGAHFRWNTEHRGELELGDNYNNLRYQGGKLSIARAWVKDWLKVRADEKFTFIVDKFKMLLKSIGLSEKIKVYDSSGNSHYVQFEQNRELRINVRAELTQYVQNIGLSSQEEEAIGFRKRFLKIKNGEQEMYTNGYLSYSIAQHAITCDNILAGGIAGKVTWSEQCSVIVGWKPNHHYETGAYLRVYGASTCLIYETGEYTGSDLVEGEHRMVVLGPAPCEGYMITVINLLNEEVWLGAHGAGFYYRSQTIDAYSSNEITVLKPHEKRQLIYCYKEGNTFTHMTPERAKGQFNASRRDRISSDPEDNVSLLSIGDSSHGVWV
ncbi:MAG: hypothetical protein CSA97_05795 [Bacteroidetes bacterium]|nr:MAG: hypothetical protein CSA97_05795 [Bacteroidota bacterium]